MLMPQSANGDKWWTLWQMNGCIMYDIFFVNFWVIILCPVRTVKPKNLGFPALAGWHWRAEAQSRQLIDGSDKAQCSGKAALADWRWFYYFYVLSESFISWQVLRNIRKISGSALEALHLMIIRPYGWYLLQINLVQKRMKCTNM